VKFPSWFFTQRPTIAAVLDFLCTGHLPWRGRRHWTRPSKGRRRRMFL